MISPIGGLAAGTVSSSEMTKVFSRRRIDLGAVGQQFDLGIVVLVHTGRHGNFRVVVARHVRQEIHPRDDFTRVDHRRVRRRDAHVCRDPGARKDLTVARRGSKRDFQLQFEHAALVFSAV
jgi:hypothetical protein